MQLIQLRHLNQLSWIKPQTCKFHLLTTISRDMASLLNKWINHSSYTWESIENLILMYKKWNKSISYPNSVKWQVWVMNRDQIFQLWEILLSTQNSLQKQDFKHLSNLETYWLRNQRTVESLLILKTLKFHLFYCLLLLLPLEVINLWLLQLAIMIPKIQL